MSRTALIHSVFEQLEAVGRGRQIMLLGGPRWGKTTALKTLRAHIQKQHRQWAVFGPFPAEHVFTQEFYSAVATWLELEGVLREPVIPGTVVSLLDFWQRVHSVTDLRHLRRVVILVDNADAARLGPENLAQLFSTVRGFHAEWREFDFTIHFVWAGCVLPSLLMDVYKGHDSASWPFERNQSLVWLPELDVDEGYTWLTQIGQGQHPRHIHARYLHEFTQGDVPTTARLLSKLDSQAITCASLMDAATKVITDADWGSELVQVVNRLTQQAREPIGVLLDGQFVRTKPHSDLEDELLLSGLTYLDDQNNQRVLRLRNWLIEATMRSHSVQLGELLGRPVFAEHSELVPPTQCLNQETFALLMEIERLLRNLIRVRLGNPQGVTHPFQGLNVEENPSSGITLDQFQRSISWRDRVAGNRWVSTHAALVSYIDTGDLLGLIGHLVADKDPVALRLKDVREYLAGFKAIRDAVMHGQIITENSLDNLIEIRRLLFAWLTVSS